MILRRYAISIDDVLICVMTSSMDIASPIFLIIGAFDTLAPNFITIDTDSLLYANSSLWYANILAIFI